MASTEQLALLKAGVEGWNEWRRKSPTEKIDLSQAFLSHTDLSGAFLAGADLTLAHLNTANLNKADLTKANLTGVKLDLATLIEADLRGTYLPEAIITRASLYKANLSGADLTQSRLEFANLSRANLKLARLVGTDLSATNLSSADLRGADLRYTNLLETKINNARFSNTKVYGVNVWDLKGEFKDQRDLIITRDGDSPITVDNIKIAQFIYLILKNQKIRDVINTLTSKAVLILGRFAIPERKAILDTLREKLREYDLLPIVFDFERPTDKDFTETIKILAGMSYFVIADVTNPKSSPLELQAPFLIIKFHLCLSFRKVNFHLP